MASLGLCITLEQANGKAVSVVRIRDRKLLVDVACSAIQEAYQEAEILKQEDETLGTLQKEEAGRLRRSLEFLIPELRHGSALMGAERVQ